MFNFSNGGTRVQKFLQQFLFSQLSTTHAANLALVAADRPVGVLHLWALTEFKLRQVSVINVFLYLFFFNWAAAEERMKSTTSNRNRTNPTTNCDCVYMGRISCREENFVERPFYADNKSSCDTSFHNDDAGHKFHQHQKYAPCRQILKVFKKLENGLKIR